MNPLVKKEIRLLLPAWVTAMTLVILPEMLVQIATRYSARPPNPMLFVLFGLGVLLLALATFGQEFSSGTFPILLAQPVLRTRIWRIKVSVLIIALFSVSLVFLLGFWTEPMVLDLGDKESLSYSSAICEFMSYSGGICALIVACALAGGLWTTLLLRQVAAAFWFTLLIPGAIVILIAGLWPEKYSAASKPVMIAALLVYSLTGFWFARRLFLQAQDVAWTGGNIAWPEMRGLKWWGERSSGRSLTKADPREPQATFDIGSSVASPHRTWRPKAALFIKELQLHQSQLIIAGVLALLHLGVIATRKFGHFPQNSSLEFALEQFWLLWLVMPALVGCAAVDEERKPGVMEGQLCLPVSRRTQFAIKFIPTIIFGTLLGGVMPILLETAAAHFGAPSAFFRPESHPYNGFGSNLVWFQISIVVLAAGLAWASFFASTLARNFLQALSIAIATILSCVLFVMLVVSIGVQRMTFFGITPWHHPALPILIAILVIPATLLWLAYLNFNHFHESWHLWRRNLLGLTGALLFIIVSSAVIYNRAWEIFEPAELPHGPAKLSLANPPKLHSTRRGGLLVQLPDNRVWFNSLDWDFLEYQPSRLKELWLKLVPPLPKSTGPQQFVAGSNWASVTATRIEWRPTEGATNTHIFGYLDTVGIQADGTLWISSEAKPFIWTGARMTRFGDETDWKEVVQPNDSFLLLKKDGTLWLWGTNGYSLNQWQTNWPSVRAFKPQQIGTNSDWKEIFSASWNNYVQKTDGSVWTVVDWKTGKDELERQTNLDQVVPQTLSRMGDERVAYVGKDGTLWVCNRHSVDKNRWQWEGTGFLQVGKETNWLAVAVNWNYMVALKSDGSLWKWSFSQDSTAKVAKIPPTRLGIHNDWVGLTGTWMRTVSLAADGSLWLWPTTEDYYGELVLLEAPKQPEFLGNVFGNAD